MEDACESSLKKVNCKFKIDQAAAVVAVVKQNNRSITTVEE